MLFFNENYLGPVTKISKKNEKHIESFFKNLIQLTKKIEDKESFEKGILSFVTKMFYISPKLRTELIFQIIKLTKSDFQTD